MTRDEFNAFCQSLPVTTHVVQWGRGGCLEKSAARFFAIGGWTKGHTLGITFKVSDIAYEVLKEQPGLRPAPYLASRGMKWIQHYDAPGLDDASLRDHLAESHKIVSRGLTKKMQRELNLYQE